MTYGSRNENAAADAPARPRADLPQSGTCEVAAAHVGRSRVLDEPELLERLLVETERAFRYHRPLAIVAVDLSEDAVDKDAIEAALLGAVRLVDVVGWDGGARLLVLLPETAQTADFPARRILDALSRLAPDARIGLACVRRTAARPTPCSQGRAMPPRPRARRPSCGTPKRSTRCESRGEASSRPTKP